VPAGPFVVRARMRLIWRSLRTIMFVIFTGHAPGGSTLCLHIGQSDELRRRKVSIQSGWKMWRHGNSRTCDSFDSKSSRHIGHVGWFNDDVGGAAAVGADEWPTSGDALTPVSGSMDDEGASAA
jgi:hypothetical protein